jgi:hypothetical protein
MSTVTVETLRAALRAHGYAERDIDRLVRVKPVPRERTPK